MARKRRKANAEDQPKRHPLLRLLTADLVLRAGSFALRRAVKKGLVSGPMVSSVAESVPDHKPSPSTRVLTAAASALATRSVPGALLVGSGMVVHALYKRGKARRAEQLPNAASVGGELPPS
jgi:hypothetical protein